MYRNISKFLIQAVLFVAILIFPGFTQITAQSLPNLVNLDDVPICADHGGVDCNITHPKAFTVCKDGTVDESFIIYTVPQCRDELEAKTKDDSAFLTKSGCFPPSEMGCISTKSYNNLYNELNKIRSVDSELSQIHLSVCSGEIDLFNSLNARYKQCLIDNGRPDFIPSGRETLPLLKSIFCPAFYGENSKYDFDVDLCLCNDGYSMTSGSQLSGGGQCVKESQVCSLKYGSNSYIKDGDCFCREGYEFNESNSGCILQNKVDIKTISVPEQNPEFTVLPDVTIPQKLYYKPAKLNLSSIFSSTTTEPVLASSTQGGQESLKEASKKENIFKKIFNKLTRVFLNIFK
jgi:hypothetical protein